MKVTVLTCFESNEERASYVLAACKEKGYDVEAITSDFSHIKKKKRDSVPDGFITIDTKPYSRNLSIERILSHRQFAKDAFRYIQDHKPDLLWIMAPANSLIEAGKLFKKDNPEVRIVVDIIDMWPESLPLSSFKNMFPFSIWRNIRRNNIDCGDVVVSECEMYHSILKNEYGKDIRTLYWARDEKVLNDRKKLGNDALSLCYIGSINNIIDIDEICRVISMIDMPCNIHIIGEGENTESFIDRLKEVCSVDYHGVIYDEKTKTDIFDRCHAGINIYKKNLYIGLTTKCIDYFRNGLPIINNIKGDTWSFVKNNGVGFNVDDNNVIKGSDIIEKRLNNDNIYNLYDENFTRKVFSRKCIEIVKEAMK